MNIKFYCIDCKIYFHIDEAKWSEDNIWMLCPECEGQEYTVRNMEVNKNG